MSTDVQRRRSGGRGEWKQESQWEARGAAKTREVRATLATAVGPFG